MRITSVFFNVLTCVTLLSCAGTGKNLKEEDWMLGPFKKMDDHNPIVEPIQESEFFCPISRKSLRWEEKHVFNPAAVARDKRVIMLYRAQDMMGTSRIGYAKSTDGLAFRSNKIPALNPDNDFMKSWEWEGGCEDPRVVKSASGQYVMTYTVYDKKTARLAVATSEDLLLWKKEGLAFRAPEHLNLWSKSGAIVCALKNGEIVAQKIQGKYWMYWGDTNIFLATSDDLIKWEPVMKKGKLLPVMLTRPGFFDSKLVEPGPFALLRKEGILLIYNSSNSGASGDKTLSEGCYTVAQALFSAKNPKTLKARSSAYFMKPEKDYEIEGQVNNVCFAEGLVWFKKQWFLYYGTADSKIAVAVCEKP